MKKFIAILSLIAVIAISVTGCSADESSSQSTAGKGIQQQSATEVAAISADQTQIVGNVTSIVGNEVVLALGDVSSETPAAGKSSDSSTDSSSKASSGKSAGGAMPSREKPSGNMPSGEKPSGDMPSGEMPTGDMPSGGMSGGAGGATVEITLNGESGTYIIPVGLSLSGISGTSSDFSKITVGMSLRLTMEADESIVGAEVLAQ